jgi:hypothetical protein
MTMRTELIPAAEVRIGDCVLVNELNCRDLGAPEAGSTGR